MFIIIFNKLQIIFSAIRPIGLLCLTVCFKGPLQGEIFVP